jgi:predicted nucleotidyltransferase
MQNKIINLGVVKKVARALDHLRMRVAFVGGAVISLYTDDPSADELRPTKDIDLSITLEGYGAWVKLQEELAALGFTPDVHAQVICRFTYEDITVDLMPDDESILGFSNPWYKPGLEKTKLYSLDQDLSIKLLPLPYFLATKFSAFHGRGQSAYRTSHDFEDIIYLTDNVTTFVEEIRNADPAVRDFLTQQYRLIAEHRYKHEIIECHLSPLIREKRLQLIENKINTIIG